MASDLVGAPPALPSSTSHDVYAKVGIQHCVEIGCLSRTPASQHFHYGQHVVYVSMHYSPYALELADLQVRAYEKIKSEETFNVKVPTQFGTTGYVMEEPRRPCVHVCFGQSQRQAQYLSLLVDKEGRELVGTYLMTAFEVLQLRSCVVGLFDLTSEYNNIFDQVLQAARVPNISPTLEVAQSTGPTVPAKRQTPDEANQYGLLVPSLGYHGNKEADNGVVPYQFASVAAANGTGENFIQIKST